MFPSFFNMLCQITGHLTLNVTIWKIKMKLFYVLPFDCPDLKVFTYEGEHILPFIEINSKRFCWGLLIELKGSVITIFFYLFWLKQSIQAYLVKHIHHIIVYKTNINILKPNVVSKCSREVVKFPILSLCHNFSLHLRRKIFFIIHVGWYRYICKTARPRKRWRRLHNLRLNNNTSLC